MRRNFTAAIARALVQWDGATVRWGYDDCAMAIANIDRDVIGFDTASLWRGRYRSRNGAVRLLGADRLLGAFRQAARRWKWKRVLSGFRDGDRGIAAIGEGQVSVIRYGAFWVGRCDRGNVLVTDRQILRAWSPF